MNRHFEFDYRLSKSFVSSSTHSKNAKYLVNSVTLANSNHLLAKFDIVNLIDSLQLE